MSVAEAYDTTKDASDILKKYEKICKLGEGTYGVVHKARNVTNNEIVALKQVS